LFKAKKVEISPLRRIKSNWHSLLLLFKSLLTEKALLLFTLILFFIYLWRSMIALGFPLYDFDGMWYHVVVVGKWMQEGKIYPVYDNLWTLSYPKNGELLSLWFALFTGGDDIMRAVSILSGIIPALASLCIFRLFSRDEHIGRFIVLAVLSMPVLIVSVGISYVDALLASMLISSTFYLLKIYGVHFKTTVDFSFENYRDGKSGREEAGGVLRGDYLLFLISLSIMAGIKTTGLSYTIIIACFALFLELIRLFNTLRALRGERESKVKLLIERLYKISIFASLLLFCSSYWYLMNYREMKNPLFPYTFLNLFKNYKEEIIGTQIPPLFYMGQYQNLPQLWPIISWLYALLPQMQQSDQRLGGLGVSYTIFYLPAALVFSYLLFTKFISPRKKDRLYISLLILVTLSVFIIDPFKWWARFTITLATTSIILFGLLIQRLDLLKSMKKIVGKFRLRKVSKVFTIMSLSLSLCYVFLDSTLTSSSYAFMMMFPKSITSVKRVIRESNYSYIYGSHSRYKMFNNIKPFSNIVFISDNQDIYYPYMGDHFDNRISVIRYGYIDDVDTLYAFLKSVKGNYLAINPFYKSRDNDSNVQHAPPTNYVTGSGHIMSNENIYILREVYNQVSQDTSRFRFQGIMGMHYIFQIL
jgi:hypothetical protein